jgi:hypothetical protein
MKISARKEVRMGKEDWTLFKMNPGNRISYVRKSFYIQDDVEKTLTALSMATGVEISLLVNEALGDLVEKYQPLAAMNLLKKMFTQ